MKKTSTKATKQTPLSYKVRASKNKQSISYFQKGTFENFIYNFCSKRGIKSVRSVMNAISLLSVVMLAVVFFIIADSIRERVILPMAKEILHRENIPYY